LNFFEIMFDILEKEFFLQSTSEQQNQ
jgi:hypothetical protein